MRASAPGSRAPPVAAGWPSPSCTTPRDAWCGSSASAPFASERAAGLVAAADVELVVELEWAAAGIVAARARLAGHPTADVVFIRDVDGRLISQRGADGTTIYQYPEAP